MKLSRHTINVLKACSSLSNHIFIGKGDSFITAHDYMSQGQLDPSTHLYAKIPETFPEVVRLYEATTFLNTLALYDDPELDFSKPNYLTLREGADSFEFNLMAANAVRSTSDNWQALHTFPSLLEFTLTQKDFKKIGRLSSLHDLDLFSLVSVGGRFFLYVSQQQEKGHVESNFSPYDLVKYGPEKMDWGSFHTLELGGSCEHELVVTISIKTLLQLTPCYDYTVSVVADEIQEVTGLNPPIPPYFKFKAAVEDNVSLDYVVAADREKSIVI